ncbi:MAG: type III secretion system export apparatus subunit SctR [Pseudomonadota bacterium]
MIGYNPIYFIGAISLLGLSSFMLMMVTSYVKIIVVTSLVRNALGVQQIPPTMVMNGLAMVLTLFIMGPVAMSTMELMEKTPINLDGGPAEFVQTLDAISPPFREFIERNNDDRIVSMFMSTARRIWPKDKHHIIDSKNLLIAIPAFTISELTKAFQIGFLLYLPFVTIDLIISNILLAMGMMMVSPMTISLPFKLLLFVTLDGWLKISQGLMLSYH